MVRLLRANLGFSQGVVRRKISSDISMWTPFLRNELANKAPHLDIAIAPSANAKQQAKNIEKTTFVNATPISRPPQHSSELSIIAAIDPKPRASVTPREDVRNAQRMLNLLGFDPGPADGLLGKQTQNAVHNFIRAYELDISNQISPTLLEALRLRVEG